MAARTLLCLSTAGVSAARWTGRLVEPRLFDDTDAGRIGLEQYLRRHAGAPVHLMVDTVDEDYRFETLPRVGGRDRREMLERKLRQLYRNSPYCAASQQPEPKVKREKGSRRESRYLFTALTSSDLLTPWLEIVARCGAPLAAIYPLPAVTAGVAAKLKLTDPNVLVISKHAAGLRQTFLKDGAFRITRLTPLRGPSEGTVDQSFAREVGNTRMYLDALSVTAADDTVQVLILDQDNSLASLRDALLKTRGNMQCQRLTREELVERLGVPPAALMATPDALHLHLLGQRLPRENLAPAALREGYRQYQLRRAMVGGAAGVAVLGALWFGLDLWRASSIDEETAEITVQTQRYQKLYQDITRQFPEAPVGSAALKQTVDVALRLKEDMRTPEPAFGILSKALEASPTVMLTSLTWKHGQSGELAGTSPSGTAPSGSAPPREMALFSGEIAPFSGDYRTAEQTIRAFVERLRSDPGVAEVKVLRWPLDASSKQTLSGSTTSRAEQVLSAPFEISMVLKPVPGVRS
jgi:hypothetical protein